MFAKAAITGTLQAGGPTFTAEYLVVAGGGGGASREGSGGGGAGGYRSSVTGESSGGGASAESALSIVLGAAYSVSVGAGGTGGIGSGSPPYSGTKGFNSTFSSVVSIGGGGGRQLDNGEENGGSGGGGSRQEFVAGVGTSGQGYSGGAGASQVGGGGGGAGAAGTAGVTSVSNGDGGDGVQSSVTGTSVYRGGGGGAGGGGGVSGRVAAGGSGGLGGGGDGGNFVGSGQNGVANTGGAGGGGAGSTPSQVGGNGGSGVVIIRVPSSVVAEFSAGIVYNYIPLDDFNVYEITAAGVSDTVTFSQGTLATIDDSLRFNDDDTAYLSQTPAFGTSGIKFTWSSWLKGAANGNWQTIFFSKASGTNSESGIRMEPQGGITVHNGSDYNITSTAVHRDPSAWFHLVVQYDSAQTIAADRVKIYVNGERLTSFVASTYPTLNFSSSATNTSLHHIGRNTFYGRYWDGYMADVYLIDDQALDPSRFGKQDADGVWQPISYTGTYGTNGFHLDFADNSTAAALGTDVSGNSNDWTPSGITTDDQVSDTPSVNYATWNPLQQSVLLGSQTLSNGNLDTITTLGGVNSTIFVSSGKWYWETKLTSGTSYAVTGIGQNNSINYPGYTSDSYGYVFNGDKINNDIKVSYGATYTTNDVIGVALDLDAGTLVFYKNGVSQGTAFTGLIGTFAARIGNGTSGSQASWSSNFGQRPFAYTPPAGFVALNSANLPAPVIADGKEHFQPVLYTGNGTSQTVRGLEFGPDFVWIKNRSAADNHKLLDAVRGATEEIESNTLDVETTNSDGLTAFNSNGFTVGADLEYNTSGESFVAWNWKANGSGVSNTDGSITATVSANTDAGFSIVSWTGNGLASQTIGHGLGVRPAVIIHRALERADAWLSWHQSLPSGYYIQLSQNNPAFNNVDVWPSAGITSSVITTTANATRFNNFNGERHIAYCFADVEGFSKFGSYTGNGSADGPFVYTGFRPAFVMIKRTDSTGGWIMLDNKRDIDNQEEHYLIANLSNAETTDINLKLDALSNGFKLRANSSATNSSGGTHIYMAFAENPFKTARAR